MFTTDNEIIPQHIAIIMDGNGRWAKKRLLSKSAGHKAGAQTLKKLAAEIEKLGVKYLTVYAFSTENWKRSASEVRDLMKLLRGYIQQYIDDTDKNEMKISVIGARDRIDPDIVERIEYLEGLTKNKKGLNVVIALDYGGRNEILRAAKKLCADVKSGVISTGMLNEEIFAGYLDTTEIPDPDLIIRTSGEMRLSNFLLWQAAYAELYFSQKLWPDFTIDDVKEAVRHYNKVDRRFGGR